MKFFFFFFFNFNYIFEFFKYGSIKNSMQFINDNMLLEEVNCVYFNLEMKKQKFEKYL